MADAVSTLGGRASCRPRSRSVVARLVAFATAAAMSQTACGYSEEEMAAKDREITRLRAALATTREQLAQDEVTFEATSLRIDDLRDEVGRLASSQPTARARAP
jgi:hypothetical protein